MLNRFILLLALITFFSTGCGKVQEPVYEGLTLKAWAERLKSPEPEVKIDALKVIESIGPKAYAAESVVRDVAQNEPNNEVAIKAIEALEAMGAPTIEFDEFLAMYYAPIIPGEEEEERTYEEELIDEEEAEMMSHISGEGDLAFLKELENEEFEEEEIDTSIVPLNSSEYEGWVESRRSSSLTDVLDILSRPEVLEELIRIGDNLEREFAVKKLATQGGLDPRIVESLERLLEDPDSTISLNARKALENWKSQ
ncbi:MAG: hypothetical protein HN590_02975 [Calditrichaeota bacterium]|nr:hypothetical protein [Calditrichota bacterium]